MGGVRLPVPRPDAPDPRSAGRRGHRGTARDPVELPLRHVRPRAQHQDVGRAGRRRAQRRGLLPGPAGPLPVRRRARHGVRRRGLGPGRRGRGDLGLARLSRRPQAASVLRVPPRPGHVQRADRDRRAGTHHQPVPPRAGRPVRGARRGAEPAATRGPGRTGIRSPRRSGTSRTPSAAGSRRAGSRPTPRSAQPGRSATSRPAPGALSRVRRRRSGPRPGRRAGSRSRPPPRPRPGPAARPRAGPGHAASPRRRPGPGTAR